MKVHLLSSDHESGQESQWEVPFDPSLREVTVSLSGPSPRIELRDPLGNCPEVLKSHHICPETVIFQSDAHFPKTQIFSVSKNLNSTHRTVV